MRRMRFILSILAVIFFVFGDGAISFSQQPATDDDGPICPPGHHCNNAGEDLDAPPTPMGRFQVNGRSPVEIQEGLLNGEIIYTAAPGELLTASQSASGDLRLMDVYRGSGIARAGFIGPTQARAIGELPQPGTLSLVPGATATLFAAPGLTEASCQRAPSTCRGNLRAGAEVQVLDAQLQLHQDIDGRERVSNYYRVSVRERSGGPAREGWIESRLVRVRTAPLVSVPAPRPPEPPCPPAGAPVTSLPQVIGRVAMSGPTASTDPIAERLMGRVGACLLDQAQRAPGAPAPRVTAIADGADNTAPGTVYSTFLRPHWNAHRADAPVPGLGGEKLTPQQIEQIDALARTIYGEIGREDCRVIQTRDGPIDTPAYYTATAASIVNRVRTLAREPSQRAPLAKQVPFVDGHFPDGRPDPIDVVLSSSQYSVWNPTALIRPRPPRTEVAAPPTRESTAPRSGRSTQALSRVPVVSSPRVPPRKRPPAPERVTVPNPSLRTLLCPPSPARPKLDNANVIPAEAASWRRAVQAATQAVLAPNDLLRRTNITTGYYTGDHVSGPQGFSLITDQKADGLTINDPSCMRLWRNPRDPR